MKPRPKHHRPKKSLGQNFLVDGNLQRKIVEALDPQPDDAILEVGPGRGALTRHLAGRCRDLFLVELDDELAQRLSGDLSRLPGVQVLNQDILDVDLQELVPRVEELKVVGNIPYNITTPILFHLLQRPRPRAILIMVQKEVGERILAEPGTSQFGALTVGVGSVAGVERVLKVPATAFRPQPGVDSVVVRVTPIHPPPLTSQEEIALRDLTRTAFQQRRKQFQAILRNDPARALSHEAIGALEGLTGFDLTQRPETFSPEEFLRLSRALDSLSAPQEAC